MFTYIYDFIIMSRKYKFHNTAGMYFVSFATINWINVFVREDYFNVVVESGKLGNRLVVVVLIIANI